MSDGYGFYIYRAKRLDARLCDWELVLKVSCDIEPSEFMLDYFGADKFEDDGDTEYYESADCYYRVEWDYLDGEEQS